MAFEDLILQTSPLTGHIYLGTPNVSGTAFVGKKKDMTSQVIGAIIQKVGIDKTMTIGVGGIEKYRITVQEISAVDAKPMQGPLLKQEPGPAVKAMDKLVAAQKKKPVTKKAVAKKVVVNPDLVHFAVSLPLSKVIGKDPLTRGQAVAKLWEYIKDKDLQSPANKRIVNCDAKLRNVFGRIQISMFEISGLLSEHLSVEE